MMGAPRRRRAEIPWRRSVPLWVERSAVWEPRNRIRLALLGRQPEVELRTTMACGEFEGSRNATANR